MKLQIVKSSSKGNAYALISSEDILLLEAGMNFRHIQKAIKYDVDKVVGCLVSHEHMDHFGYSEEYMSRGVEIYASQGTLNSLRSDIPMAKAISAGRKIQLGGFHITPFEVKHDAEEPLGFYIYHKEMGFLAFATDTYSIKYRFDRLDHLIIEANYEKEIVEQALINGSITIEHRDRILLSHMELGNACKYISSLDTELKTVVLIHTSARHSQKDLFIERVKEVTTAKVIMAENNMEATL